MDQILESVEEILAGAESGAVDVPVEDLPDYLPRMDGGGSSGGC
jgi:hypothetical protein